MKILVIEGRQTVGGGQVVTKSVCESLREKHDVAVFIPGDEKSPIASLLADFPQFYFKTKEYRRGKKGIRDYFDFVGNLLSVSRVLYKTCKEFAPDILYVQHLSLLPIIFLVNLVCRKKVIAHVHVVYVDGVARKIINAILKTKSVVKVIGVSDYCLSQFEGIASEKCEVLYNPIRSLPIQKNPMGEPYNIAVIGDVCESKGHHVLLKALQGKSMKCNVHIVGRVVDENYRTKLDKDFNDVPHCYTGMISDVSAYLREHRVVVVVVSVVGFETFSLAMTEAWGMGIPTVATDDFGMKELVHNLLPAYKDNVLFQLGDSDALYDKLFALLHDKSLYNSFSEDAHKAVQDRLSVRIFADTINDIISGFVSN